jgi:hypothetical protein
MSWKIFIMSIIKANNGFFHVIKLLIDECSHVVNTFNYCFLIILNEWDNSLNIDIDGCDFGWVLFSLIDD